MAALAVAATVARRDDSAWVSLASGGTELTCIIRTHSSHDRGTLTRDQIDQLRPPDADARPVDQAELTDTDRLLLTELAKDSRVGYPALAAATGVPESTARRRLADLRHAGRLYFDIEADPPLFGYTIEVGLWMTVAPAQLNTVAAALAQHPEIAFAAAVTGPTTMFAFVICRDADAFYDYLADRIGVLPGVLQVETAPTTRRVKRSGALLMPA
nr:Transcriptional regulator, AsnC family [Kibdelosporangium sp. MJ126-NF4]